MAGRSVKSRVEKLRRSVVEERERLDGGLTWVDDRAGLVVHARLLGLHVPEGGSPYYKVELIDRCMVKGKSGKTKLAAAGDVVCVPESDDVSCLRFFAEEMMSEGAAFDVWIRWYAFRQEVNVKKLVGRESEGERVGRQKISMTAHLEREQLETLGKLSKVLGKPVAVLIREGIDMVLEREKDRPRSPMVRKHDRCIWCFHDFGVIEVNRDGRPVRCWPACSSRTWPGFVAAERAEDVQRVMVLAKKEMDDLSCRPPSDTKGRLSDL